MTSVFGAGILSLLLALSFEGQHRRQVSIAYVLLEAPFLESVLQLSLPIDELQDLFENARIMKSSYVTKKLSSIAMTSIISWRDRSSSI